MLFDCVSSFFEASDHEPESVVCVVCLDGLEEKFACEVKMERKYLCFGGLGSG